MSKSKSKTLELVGFFGQGVCEQPLLS